MATDVQDLTIEEKIGKLRELFADAPEVGKQALENALQELTAQASKTLAAQQLQERARALGAAGRERDDDRQL